MKWQLLFIYLILILGCKNMTPINDNTKITEIAEMQYFDGSGNEYKITSNTIEYLPVSKIMSSSGIYSGGEQKSNSISDKDFLKIKTQFDYLFNKTDIHIKNRIKTSGMIRFTFKNSKRRAQIIKKSTELEELEKLLKLILNKS